MGAAREKDQADFDLERFADMFDEAMMSRDPRVIDALRSLMMIVTLTRPEARNPMADKNHGPLRRLFEDINHLNKRLYDLEDRVRSATREAPVRREYAWDEDKYTLAAARQVAQQIDQDAINDLKLAAQAKGLGLYKK